MDLDDEIRKLAYELYEKSGKIAGRDIDNWLEAEKIIRARRGGKRNPETEQSSSPKKKRISTSKKASKK
ncbi:MAG: DUF2934 domain-containing protein [Nitrospira sp.]|nr:DUF2934 domain-containing protein [Nitrospira sp.]